MITLGHIDGPGRLNAKVCHERGKGFHVGGILLMRCCARDEGIRPFGVVLWGRASNRRMLHWLKTVVVSDTEKAPVEASGRDQGDGAQPRKKRFRGRC
jgi:hypothetical protein